MEKKEEKEKFVKKIAEDIEQYLSTPSRVRRNKNDKTISVSHAFDFGRIPIKIITSEEVWAKLEKKCFENDFDIEFEDIRPYLKASAKNIAKLERYSMKFPEDFVEHFYYYYIELSKYKNTLVTKKPRGRLPHKRKTSEMWKIKTAARHLYIFLDHWLRQPLISHPQALKNYLNENSNIKIDWDKDVDYISTVGAAMQIIENHFNFDIENIDDPKTFYNKYIAYQGLDHLKMAYQKKAYQIFTEPLLSIFRTN